MFKRLLLSSTIIFTLCALPVQNASAEMNPKTKAFMIVSAYGTALGALLGIASLAFDAKPRAIAQGASLGLYAGLIFGAYIINSHGKKNEVQPGTYQDAITPYQSDNIPPPDDPYSDSSDAYGGSFFDTPQRYSFQPSGNFSDDLKQFKTKSHPNSIPLYMELMRVNF